MGSINIPKEQKAWVLYNLGGSIQDYTEETIPTPEIDNTERPYDLLVQNYAISLNPTDAKARSGWYGPSGKQDKAKIGGRDASGVVVAVGDKAQGFKAGDEVL